MKKSVKILLIILAAILLFLLVQMIVLGRNNYFGPFKFLNISKIVNKYSNRPQGEIIFYGGSNFRRWATVESDLSEYPIQNKAFGGSDDIERFAEADKLIYPSKPTILVYMSSSNDWTGGRSSEEIIAFKQNMFEEMAQELPDTVFVILSSTPNPLRYFGEYHDGMVQVNQWLEEYCQAHERFEYLDVVTPLTQEDGTANEAIWGSDRLHLNEDGYRLLTEVMRSALQSVCEKHQIPF